MENTYTNPEVVIDLSIVQHVEYLNRHINKHHPEGNITTEKIPNGIHVITKFTNWNFGHDCWDNPIYIGLGLQDEFIKAWTNYIAEKNKGK